MDRKLYEKLGVKIYEPANKVEGTGVDSKWWGMPAYEEHNSVIAVVSSIKNQQSVRRLTNLKHARAYSNRNILGFEPSQWSKVSNSQPKSDALVINSTRSAGETICAKISKNRPEVRFVTSGADWELQEKARLATKFIEGLFDDCNFYEEHQKVFRDSVIQDIGALKIYSEDEQVKVIRIFPEELLVDEEDSANGYPTHMYQETTVNAAGFAAKYPQFSKEISDANNKGRLKIVEAWHLPCNKGAQDGRHVVVIDGKTLFSEQWDKDYFPIVFLRWSESIRGFYGTSFVEDVLPIQRKMNKLLKMIDRGLEGAIPRAYFDSASKINKASYTDEIWSAFTYTGTKPSFSPTAAFPPEVYNFLWQLDNQIFQKSGVSQMSATGMKTPGVDAAVAMRELQDIETQRFALPSQRWEKSVVDAAKIALDLVRDIAKANKGFKIKVRDGKNMSSVDWLKDLDLEEDQFLLKAFPVSQLPQSPAGRLSMVTEMMDKGLIKSTETALSLLNLLDLEKFMSLETAGTDNVNMIISLMLNKGIYTTPTKYLPLEQGIKFCQNALLRGQTEGRSEESLDLLRTWIEEASAVLDSLNAPAAPAQDPNQPQQDPNTPATAQAPPEGGAMPPPPPGMPQ